MSLIPRPHRSVTPQTWPVFAACAVLCCLVICSIGRAEEQAEFPGTRVLKNLSYVEDGHERQKLDLYLPEKGEKLPLVIWIHGGGWESGSKEIHRGREAMLQAGYATASLDYRYSNDAPFPAQLEDCQAAIRWLRKRAAEYRLDSARFGVWGESAGGHLAALVGVVDEKLEIGEPSARVQAVCDFFGPTDLALYQESQPGDVLSRLIGGTIQENVEKVQAANPVSHVSKDDPPFLIVHGEKDGVVPLLHSKVLESALSKAGVPVTLHVVPGAGHAITGAEVDQLVCSFFNQHLKVKQSSTGLSAITRLMVAEQKKPARQLPPLTEKEQKAIQQPAGIWTVREVTRDGQAVGMAANAVQSIEGDQCVLTLANGITVSGTFRLNPDETPSQLDLYLESGPLGRLELQGIYEVSEKSMRICLGEPMRGRPFRFESVPGGGTVLLTLSRKQ